MQILPGWVAGNRASASMCSRCRRPRIRPPPRALSVTRHAFGLTWTQTLRAAWWVLRANQVWAPYPDNDPDAARRYMAFYAPVGRVNGERIDPRAAAVLEVRWWHVHRTLQREEPGEGEPLATRSRGCTATCTTWTSPRSGSQRRSAPTPCGCPTGGSAPAAIPRPTGPARARRAGAVVRGAAGGRAPPGVTGPPPLRAMG